MRTDTEIQLQEKMMWCTCCVCDSVGWLMITNTASDLFLYHLDLPYGPVAELLTHKPWRQYCTISVWITLSQIIIIYNPVPWHNESIFSNIQRAALAKCGVLLAWAAKYITLYIKLSCDPKYDQRKDIKTGKKHDTMQYKQWANHHKNKYNMTTCTTRLLPMDANYTLTNATQNITKQ